MIDPIQHWAMIMRDIRVAQKEAKEQMLKNHGISKKALDELESEAYSLMDGNFISTDYGNIQKDIVGKVTYRPLSNNVKPKTNKLTFIPKE
jgi:hypothetical protein